MANDFTVIKGGRLIDGTGAGPIPDSVLVIKGDSIQAVGRAGKVEEPAGAKVIQAAGKTVMPGLIEGHVHLAGLVSMSQLTWLLDDPVTRGMRSVIDAWKLIDAGFTTVRCCGGAIALYLKKVVNEGGCIGPRLVAAGQAITQTGGHADILHSAPVEWNDRMRLGRIADGVSEVRKACREQIRAGADFIKIMTTGGVMSETDKSSSSQFSLEEIRAAVEEAEHVGLMTATHAQGTRGIKSALIGGVNVIEHAMYLDEECLELLQEPDRYVVPTLAIVQAIIDKGPLVGVLESSLNKARLAREAHLDSIRRALEAGVICGLGTDYLSDPMSPMGANAVELELYVKLLGLSPLETIVCATRNNARVAGLADKLGTLEPGKWADLLVVKGDPLEDITLLKDRANIELVFKGGRQVPRLEPTWLRTGKMP